MPLRHRATANYCISYIFSPLNVTEPFLHHSRQVESMLNWNFISWCNSQHVEKTERKGLLGKIVKKNLKALESDASRFRKIMKLFGGSHSSREDHLGCHSPTHHNKEEHQTFCYNWRKICYYYWMVLEAWLCKHGVVFMFCLKMQTEMCVCVYYLC